MTRNEPLQKLEIVSLLLAIYSKLRSIFGTKALIVLSIVLGVLYKWRAKKHDNIPGAATFHPIIGHALFLNKHFHTDWLPASADILLKRGKEQALFSMVLPTRTQIFTADPKIADLVFRERFSDAVKGEEAFEPLKVLLGDGIFTSNGARWKKHRSTASHMFTVRSLRDYMFEVFEQTTDRLLDKVDEIAVMKNSDVVDFYDLFNRLTFEAFTKIAFGVDVGCISSAPKQAEFGYRFDRCFHLVSNRVFSAIPWKFKRKYKFLGIAPYEYEIDEHSEWLEKYVMNIIEERKQFYKQQISNKSAAEKRKLKRGNTENKLNDRYDLLSMFIDENPNITDKELRDITFSFIIAGKDTTAQMLSWFMYHICTHNLQHIFDGVRKEIKEVFGTDNYDELQMEYDKVNKCSYIECCLKESLRLYPSVPHLVREAVTDIKLPNGYTLRKGDEVFVSAFAMGRMPWVWKDPLEFKPERFQDAKNQPDPSVYPAFNIAPRICLGRHVALLEGKIAVIKLFTKYKSITAVKEQTVTWVPSPTMQMGAGGFQAHLRK